MYIEFKIFWGPILWVEDQTRGKKIRLKKNFFLVVPVLSLELSPFSSFQRVESHLDTYILAIDVNNVSGRDRKVSGLHATVTHLCMGCATLTNQGWTKGKKVLLSGGSMQIDLKRAVLNRFTHAKFQRKKCWNFVTFCASFKKVSGTYIYRNTCFTTYNDKNVNSNEWVNGVFWPLTRMDIAGLFSVLMVLASRIGSLSSQSTSDSIQGMIWYSLNPPPPPEYLYFYEIQHIHI